MRNKKVLLIVQAALIAAIYVVLTYFISAFNLASGAIQVRISEALTILPVFTPAAIPGLFIGCLLSNLLTGCMPLDVVFGSLATLIGACGTYALRKHKWLAPLPPIVANTVIVPFVLAYVYMAEGTIPFFMLTVGIGEVISCYVLGMILYKVLNNYRSVIFKNEYKFILKPRSGNYGGRDSCLCRRKLLFDNFSGNVYNDTRINRRKKWCDTAWKGKYNEENLRFDYG